MKTGFVSPQYHVVFDDLFETVFSSGANDALVDSICENLYGTSCEIYATDEYDAHDNLVYKPPPLDEIWLDAEGREQSKIELRKQRKCFAVPMRPLDQQHEQPFDNQSVKINYGSLLYWCVGLLCGCARGAPLLTPILPNVHGLTFTVSR